MIISVKSARDAPNPLKDPARLEWHEVKKVAHYYLSVETIVKDNVIKYEY